MNIEAIAASIAHEMAQPLAAIATNGDAVLEFLDKSPPHLAQARIALNDMIEGSHHTAKVIDGIRTLFRKVDQERQQVDMNEIALEVLQSLRAELADHGVISSPELASSIPLVDGDRSQLQQVVFNLVHNAIEAMTVTSDQKRQLRLRTEHRGDDAIVLAVQDSGPGINPERLDEIFDAFVTTKAKGMGLGLAICRTIVERHGGRLIASSDGNDGALFELILPIKPTTAPPVRAQ
jgi:signal transduction histidine kinase